MLQGNSTEYFITISLLNLSSDCNLFIKSFDLCAFSFLKSMFSSLVVSCVKKLQNDSLVTIKVFLIYSNWLNCVVNSPGVLIGFDLLFSLGVSTKIN